MSGRKEYELPESEGEVPEREDWVMVTESTGLKYPHVLTSEVVVGFLAECQLKHPNNYQLDRLLNSWKEHRSPIGGGPSHRFPTTKEERERAYGVGVVLGEINRLSEDPSGDIQDMLLIAAGICLSGGFLTDEQVVEMFAFSERKGLIWEEARLPGLGKAKKAYYSKEAKSRAQSILKFTGFDSEIGETHPVPETFEQRETAMVLRALFEQFMDQVIYHEARNYVLAAAARAMQLGLIYTKSFEKVTRAYSNSLSRDRGARYYDEAEDEGDDEEYGGEDEENLKPWGNI